MIQNYSHSGADILIFGSYIGRCPNCGGGLWGIIDTDLNAMDITCSNSDCGFYDPGVYPRREAEAKYS